MRGAVAGGHPLTAEAGARVLEQGGNAVDAALRAGLGDDTELSVMEHVDVDFSGGSTQRFHIGAASCAIPGAALGLETAHKMFGRLPWRDLFQPAIELARGGVELNDGQAYLHRILDLILRHTPDARAVYEHADGPLRVG